MKNYVKSGFTSLTPTIYVDSPTRVAEYYKTVFGAVINYKLVELSGTDFHVEMEIDGSKLLLVSTRPEWNISSASALGGMPGSFQLYVEDPDEIIEKCIESGASELVKIAVLPGGDYGGSVRDPFGVNWLIVSSAKRGKVDDTRWAAENFEFEVVEVEESSSELLVMCCGACSNC